MFKKLNRKSLAVSAAFVAGMASAQDAHAGGGGGGGGNSFDNVWQNIANGIAGLPSLITIAAYIFGIVFAVLGVLKIKEHVENPQQTPLKQGAIQLCVGGALFTLPFLMDIMSNLIDGNNNGTAVQAQTNVGQLQYNAG